MTEMFAQPNVPPDTATTRTCGTCGQVLPLDQYYKDGTDKDGKPKHRRDCKNCYRITRLTERKNKREGGKSKK